MFVGASSHGTQASVSATESAIGAISLSARRGIIMKNPASLGKVDELIHIGRRMRSIALQSAVGGMALSLVGMLAAALGYLPPLEGAIAQEVIDLAAVLNAVSVVMPFNELTDF